MITRGKTGIHKPKLYNALKHPLLIDHGPSELSSVAQDLQDPQWKKAIQDKFDALIRNQTWELVPHESHFNVVGNKWVFKVKFNSDGTLQRYKGRLVAKGFHQTPRIKFCEIFSPIIKPTIVRLVLTLAITYG